MAMNKENVDLAEQSLTEALNLSLKILKGIMVLLLVLFLSSGIFTVEQNQEAMIISFGNIQGNMIDRVLKPGLHWTWPYPFSEVIKIPSHEIKLVEIKGTIENPTGESDIISNFWYQDDGAGKSPGETLDPELDGYCLLGDANIVHCRWQLRYLINDPYQYYVQANNPAELIQSIVSNAMVKVMANCVVPEDAVLGNLVDKIGPEVKQLAQSELDAIRIGVEIQVLAIVELSPPRQAKEVFDSVLKAKAEQDKKIAEANNYYDQMIAQAVGEQAEILAKARNEALRVEKEAEGDANYFQGLLALGQGEIFYERHYQQVIENMTQKLQEIFLFANHVTQRELRIQLNRNPDLYKIQAGKED